MQIKPTIVTVLDTRHKKKTGRYPLKLRITFQKQQKYYSIGYDLTNDEFHMLQEFQSNSKNLTLRNRRKMQEIKISCDSTATKASEIINRLPFFSFDYFEKKFLIGNHSRDSVYLYYEGVIAKLKQAARIATASSYTTSMNALKKFAPKLSLRDVSVEFLQRFERGVLDSGRSVTTVGIYLRPLRAIINQAIEEGEFIRELYPFGKRKYQIPVSRNIKKALTAEEIGRIVNFSVDAGTWFEKARDIFTFSYFGNGINIKDILRLRYSNIDGEYVRFTRAKTANTNRTNGKLISFHLTTEQKRIINSWGNPLRNSDEFIFPVLREGLTPEKELAEVQQFTKMVNKYLAQISNQLEIGKKVTTYFARHSFATILKKSDVTPLYISEALGHTSLKTTQNYLDSFEDDRMKEISELLRKF